MARQFDSNNKSSNRLRIFYRTKWEREVYPENGGIGPKMITDFNFAERVLYGRINRAHDPIFLKKSNQFYHQIRRSIIKLSIYTHSK